MIKKENGDARKDVGDKEREMRSGTYNGSGVPNKEGR
jgi:hypothetical protein